MNHTGAGSKIIGCLGTAALVMAAVTSAGRAGAHDPHVVLTGAGTARIDGKLDLNGEWTRAARYFFLANLPEADGGGTTPATLFAMNDSSRLYLALLIRRASFGGATNPTFEFDNDHDGVREPGDDVVGMSVGVFSPPRFLDVFRRSCSGAEPDSAGCSSIDAAQGGTNDGMTAASNDGRFTTIELSHPLDSADDLHDFSLRPGDTVGFALDLRLFALNPANNSFTDTSVPEASFASAEAFGDIVIATP